MITKELFNSLFPTKGLTSPKNLKKFNLVRRRDELIAALNKILPKYKIDNYFRLCAFLGNCGIETDYFKTTIEYASGWDYDISVNPVKARGLGNLTEGDGPRYKGSGLTQTTGKNNFKAVQRAIGKLLDIDVVQSPEILRQNIEVAVESACIFWRDNNLNSYADRGEFKKLSAIVNRGDEDKTPLHWAKRNALYKILLVSVPENFKFVAPVVASNVVANQAVAVVLTSGIEPPEAHAVPPAPPASEPPADKPADDSFLSNAFDRNVSADEVKSAARSAAPRILVRFARPFVMLYAALEAGSVYAWLGVALGALLVGLLIYWHRDDLKKIFQTVKNKFLQ